MGITQSGAASSFQLYLRQSQDLLLTGIPWNASGPLIWFRFTRYREATCHLSMGVEELSAYFLEQGAEFVGR